MINFGGYFQNMIAVVNPIDSSPIVETIRLLRKVSLSNNYVFIIGNGGSASTAQHFATDLGVGSLSRGNPIRALALSDNPAVCTAISNDLDFEKVFEKQIELFGTEKDILISISASGNSANLLCAVQAAKKIGMTTIAMTAFDGGLLRKISDVSIHFETENGQYGLAENIHLSLCHYITDEIRKVNSNE